MYGEDVNIVVLTGNLTANVELVTAPSGTVVANYRLGVNGRRKVGDQWVDKPNFFSITTFGKQAENDAKYLKKGRRVLVEGRLDWSEWAVEGEEKKRQGVKVIPSLIKYLPTKTSIEEQLAADKAGETTAGPTGQESQQPEPVDETPAPGAEPVGVGAGPEEDIPF